MTEERIAFECIDCGEHHIYVVGPDEIPTWAMLARRCGDCAGAYPESLLKATHDEFDYALGVRSGVAFRFRKAEIRGDFVHLDQIQETYGLPGYPLERGADIRIDEIVWCCDAPHGS